MLWIKETTTTIYKVVPTAISLFLIKEGVPGIILNSDSYDELPIEIKEACRFVDNRFGTVSEVLENFTNDLVFVNKQFKTVYHVTVCPDLMNVCFHKPKGIDYVLFELIKGQNVIGEFAGVIVNKIMETAAKSPYFSKDIVITIEREG